MKTVYAVLTGSTRVKILREAPSADLPEPVVTILVINSTAEPQRLVLTGVRPDEPTLDIAITVPPA
jgi:hypothetical protein